MSRKILTFAFEELSKESGRGRFGKEGNNSLEIVYKIAWTDLPAFIKALRGGWQLIATNTWGYATPDEHPDFSGFFCTEVGFDCMGQPSFDTILKRSSWEYARVTATYKPGRFDPSTADPKKRTTHDLAFSASVMMAPPGSFKYGTTVFQEPVPIVVPVVDYKLTVYEAPELPGGDTSLIYNCVGKYNANTFLGATTKKLIYMGASAKDSKNDSGATVWQIEHHWKYRAIEWTKIWMPGQAAPVEIVAVADSNRLIYESDGGAFDNLLPR